MGATKALGTLGERSKSTNLIHYSRDERLVILYKVFICAVIAMNNEQRTFFEL